MFKKTHISYVLQCYKKRNKTSSHTPSKSSFVWIAGELSLSCTVNSICLWVSDSNLFFIFLNSCTFPRALVTVHFASTNSPALFSIMVKKSSFIGRFFWVEEWPSTLMYLAWAGSSFIVRVDPVSPRQLPQNCCSFWPRNKSCFLNLKTSI